MKILAAILIGIIGGLVGAVPFVVARSRVKARLQKDGVGSIIIGLGATLISFFVLLAEILLCFLVVKDYLLPFAMSAIVVFILAMGVYTVTLMRK